jgi:hypothetical protein
VRFPNILALILLVFANAPAQAQLYVGKTGNDANPCTSPLAPCLTINGAIAKVPGGSLGMAISIGAGSYAETVNIYYYRAIDLFGDCSNPGLVEILTVSVGIVVQDHAIGIIRCLTITATGDGATGIETRQWAIADVDRVRFSGFPLGTHIVVRESSRLACKPGPNGEPIVLGGGASMFAAVNDGSHLYLDCPVLFQGSTAQTYSYFIRCAELSVCKTSGLAWTGPNITGKQFYCDSSYVTQPGGNPPTGYSKGIPGNGFDDADSRCTIR